MALFCYVGAETFAIASLIAPRESWARLAGVGIAAGLVLHFGDLMHRGRELGSVPYRTLGGSVSLFGWMLGIAYLLLLLRHRERAMGPFLIPLVVVATAGGLLLPDASATAAQGTHGSVFALHVTLAILAYAAFTFSFVLSILYLIQNRQLKRRRIGVLFSRLPALEVIGRMNRTAVSIAFTMSADDFRRATSGSASIAAAAPSGTRSRRVQVAAPSSPRLGRTSAT